MKDIIKKVLIIIAVIIVIAAAIWVVNWAGNLMPRMN